MSATKLFDSISRMSVQDVMMSRSAESFSFGDYNSCEGYFKEAFLIADKTITQFEFLPEYKQIVEWMTNTQGKGLLLSGGCGLGKSVIITGVIPILFHFKFNRIIHPVSAIDMGAQFEDLKKRYFLCLDDIGSEATQSDYGERREIFSELVQLAEKDMKPLFISTNMTGAQMRERYGDRVVSRLVRLCRPVKFDEHKDMRF